MPRIKKEDQKQITIFKPTEVKVIDINTCLSGDRAKGNKLSAGVLHIYTYIIKRSLGQWEGEFGSHWIQIPYEMLRSFLTHRYLAIVDNLVKSNLLEVQDWAPCNSEEKKRNWKAPVQADNSVVKKGECKLYRIPECLYGKSKKYSNEKFTISKKDIKKFQAVNKRRSQATDEYRSYVCDMMRTVVIIDTLESRAILEHLYANNSIRLQGSDFLDLFNKSPFNETVIDGFGYRCFGQVVYHPRELRSVMRFDCDLNSKLVEIDLVNSQPAILASVTPELIKRFAPECGSAIPLFDAMEGDADWAKFQLHCFTSCIYENLRDKYNEMYGNKMASLYTRDDAKNIFYVAAYSDYEYMDGLSLEDEEIILRDLVISGLDSEKQKHKVTSIRSFIVFKTLYKNVYQLFKDIKNLAWGKINPSEKHSNNCLLAQRIESGIVYTVFVKALLKAGIEKLFTVHDAIVVREQDEPIARIIIEVEIDKLKLQLQLKNKFKENE